MLALVLCLGAVMFYFLLYRSRIVPRRFYVAADLLAMYAVIGADSTEQVLKMVLAVWMIARGFRPAAVSTTSELADGRLAGA